MLNSEWNINLEKAGRGRRIRKNVCYFPQIQIHWKTLGFFIEENLSDTNTNSIRFKKGVKAHSFSEENTFAGKCIHERLLHRVGVYFS